MELSQDPLPTTTQEANQFSLDKILRIENCALSLQANSSELNSRYLQLTHEASEAYYARAQQARKRYYAVTASCR